MWYFASLQFYRCSILGMKIGVLHWGPCLFGARNCNKWYPGFWSWILRFKRREIQILSVLGWVVVQVIGFSKQWRIRAFPINWMIASILEYISTRCFKIRMRSGISICTWRSWRWWLQLNSALIWRGNVQHWTLVGRDGGGEWAYPRECGDYY